MKRSKFLQLAFIGLFTLLSILSEAQEWRYINTYKGVDVYWRYRKEAYATKYICELKFDNQNDYKVQINYRAYFICSSGDEYTDSGNQFNLAANSSKGGQFAGFWWYPCSDGRAPSKGGYRDMEVKQIDY